jgi:methylmalonyl-CoA/ethylmalonyl-CoA epimerase
MPAEFIYHHIGYAVENINDSLSLFGNLGYKIVQDIINDKKRKVAIAFVKNGDLLVELISPLSEESPIRNYLNKMGHTPYHICYEVEDIQKSIGVLKKSRFFLVEKPSDAEAIENRSVAFLYHPKYGLLELLEK